MIGRSDDSERFLLDMQSQLMRSARLAGLSNEDAEDLVAETLAKCLENSAFQRENSEGKRRIAFRAFKNLSVDHFASPGRILGKRVTDVLRNPQGSDPIVEWKVDDLTFVGFRSQKAVLVKGSLLSELERNLSDFLFGINGMSGDNPGTVSTRFLLSRLFSWSKGALPKSFVINLLTTIVPVPEAPSQLNSIEILVEPPMEPANHSDMISCLQTLPFRMRASLLLSLPQDSLETMYGESWRQDLSAELYEWNPPPRLDQTDVPLDDQVVAAKLGITKGSLQVTRNRARFGLRQKMGQGL